MRERPQRRYSPNKAQRMDTLKKGVYILPNFMTSMSLLCGFYAVVSTMKGDFVRAAWVIILAAVFDGLDGRIARMTNTTSKFGMEYDSLADLVAFGVAPAVLAYGLVLNQYGRWGWLAAFLYVACGAIRLARFNVMASTESSSFFQGLPIPAAAGMIASTIVFCFHFDIVDRMLLGICFMLMMYAEAFLMVSSVRFKSFKDLDLKSRKPFSAVVVIILLICVVASEPQIMLFVIGLAYLCSGPLEYAVRRFKKEKQEDANVLHAEDENGWKQKE